MSDKIVEKLEYKTQIHTAWDGTEQRMALRSEPRRFVSYDYIGNETWQSQYLRMLTFGQQTISIMARKMQFRGKAVQRASKYNNSNISTLGL